MQVNTRSKRGRAEILLGGFPVSSNPFTGEFYLEALHMSRMTREMLLPDGGSARPSVGAVSRQVGTVATV